MRNTHSPVKTRPLDTHLQIQNLERLRVRTGQKSQTQVGETFGKIDDTLNFLPEVQTRRQAWSQLANKIGIRETLVSVTNTGISIEGVANFELYDSEDASYNELEKGEKGGFTNVPEIEIWEKFQRFMLQFTSQQQEIFLTQVMNMDTTKRGRHNAYLSAPPPHNSDNIRGLIIDGVKAFIGFFNRGGLGSVRRMKNS